MDIFIVTDFPKTCSSEVKELINKSSEEFENICFVKDITKKEIAKLSYRLQSSRKICVNICNFKIKDFEKDIEKNLTSISDEYLENNNTFGVQSEHSPNILSSQKINETVGGKIKDLTKLEVNLSNPAVSFYGVASEYFFLGIDVIGFDMSKRPYKIASQADALNGAFAYELLHLCNFKRNSSLLDPFAGSGMIPIEAALFSTEISAFKFENKFNGFKLNFIKKEFLEQENEEKNKDPKNKNNIYAYDMLLKHVLGMQKNAKLAGIDKNITMSKISLDWLDTKIEENSIDFIITDAPKLNKKLKNDKDIIKVFDELFYQSKFVLSEKGIVGILTNSEEIVKEQAEKHGFVETNNNELIRGEQKFSFIQFKQGE